MEGKVALLLGVRITLAEAGGYIMYWIGKWCREGRIC